LEELEYSLSKLKAAAEAESKMGGVNDRSLTSLEGGGEDEETLLVASS